MKGRVYLWVLHRCFPLISNPFFSAMFVIVKIIINKYVHVNTPILIQGLSSSCVSRGRLMWFHSSSWFLHCEIPCVCSINTSDSLHPTGTIKLDWFQSKNLQCAAGQAGEFIQVSMWWVFFVLHVVLPHVSLSVKAMSSLVLPPVPHPYLTLWKYRLAHRHSSTMDTSM